MRAKVKVCLLDDSNTTIHTVYKSLVCKEYSTLLETEVELNEHLELINEPLHLIEQPIAGKVIICYQVESPHDGKIIFIRNNRIMNVKSLGGMKIDLNTKHTQKEKNAKRDCQ